MKDEVKEAGKRTSSIHWLPELLLEEKHFAPSANFWSVSSYNPRGQAVASGSVIRIGGGGESVQMGLRLWYEARVKGNPSAM